MEIIYEKKQHNIDHNNKTNINMTINKYYKHENNTKITT